MAQIYSVLRTEEKTDGYREDIQSKLSGITADFAVLAAVEDVFPEADLQAACAAMIAVRRPRKQQQSQRRYRRANLCVWIIWMNSLPCRMTMTQWFTVRLHC